MSVLNEVKEILNERSNVSRKLKNMKDELGDLNRAVKRLKDEKTADAAGRAVEKLELLGYAFTGSVKDLKELVGSETEDHLDRIIGIIIKELKNVK